MGSLDSFLTHDERYSWNLKSYSWTYKTFYCTSISHRNMTRYLMWRLKYFKMWVLMRVMEKLLHSYESHFLQSISHLKLKLCQTLIILYFKKANKAKRRNFSSYITGCMIRSTGAETGRQSWGSGMEGLHWLENDQNSGLFSRQA